MGDQVQQVQALLDWIAVDWGTSQLRAWAMAADGRVLAMRHSEQGMGQVQKADYESVFLALVQDWLGTEAEHLPVWICGMAGSREGWQEAPYISTPVYVPAQLKPVAVTTQDTRLQVYLIPGIKQPAPANVMRGEETQLAGFLLQNPGFSGVLALPGTHTKWLSVENAQLKHFSTTMTGELFKLLGEQSILRHSMHDKHWQPEYFVQCLQAALKNPQAIYEKLFSLRAADLLKQTDAGQAYTHLSALLMALDINTLKQSSLQQNPHPDTRPLAIIGNAQLGDLYALALKTAGIPAQVYSGEDLVLAGLSAIKHQHEHPQDD